MALFLTARPNEPIYVGDDVVVEVVCVKGNQVRLAFSAPKEVNILRAKVKARNEAPAAEEAPDGD